MGKLKEFVKNDHIKASFVSGLCIIILALVMKKVLHVDWDASSLQAAIPGFIFTIYETARTKTRNPRSAGPIADWVKEWTELIVPDLVRNVPRMVRENAPITRMKFQAWSMFRRCWTMAE